MASRLMSSLAPKTLTGLQNEIASAGRAIQGDGVAGAVKLDREVRDLATAARASIAEVVKSPTCFRSTSHCAAGMTKHGVRRRDDVVAGARHDHGIDRRARVRLFPSLTPPTLTPLAALTAPSRCRAVPADISKAESSVQISADQTFHAAP